MSGNDKGIDNIKIQQQLEYYNQLSDKLNELFFSYDEKAMINFMNRKFADLLGCQAQDMIGSSVLSLTSEAYRDLLAEELDKCLQKERFSSYEIPLLIEDGSERSIRFYSAPVFEDGRIIGGLALGVDVIAHRHASELQRITEEKLAAAFNLSPEMIAISSLEDGRYLEVNDAFVNLFGYSREEIIGKTVRELNIWVNPRNRARLQKMILKNPMVRGLEDSFRKKSGDTWTGICSFARLNIDGEACIITVGTDVTEKRRMEAELLKAAKHESLGMLAGGLAHDFNNLLTIIMGNITLSKMLYPDEEDLTRFLHEAEKAAAQARSLTQQLLTFARGGAPVMKVTVMEGLLKEAVAFSLSGSQVKSEFNLEESLWKVNIDEGQINQVINNLILNAIQAMPDGGTIRVEAVNMLMDELPRDIPLKAGPYIKISISDQGKGIPEHCLEKIFDPYFTTKENGTGLGLATSFSIINRHGGHLCCESSPGQGACFHIYLPAVCDEAEWEAEDEHMLLRGEGRVLVMDDQERIRTMLAEMLTRLGYEPQLVIDGEECIEKYWQAIISGKPFKAVIMDLTIPGGMGGKRTFERLREIDPYVKVIISSGYADDLLILQHQRWGFQAVLAKPYGIMNLSEVLHWVLNCG